MPDIKFGTSLPSPDEKVAVDEAVESHGPVTIELSERLVSVSYTHLTLPTICSV